MNNTTKSMRDVLIEKIHEKMSKDEKIFFASGDMGAPALDKLRKKFKNRFVNAGIAEQNLINISTGLALEGFSVYAYGIAPFITMRPYEQIRNNLSLLSQEREINVNLIGVGSGVSYEVSGPTHHCLEDITIMNALPKIVIFSPSDNKLVEEFVDFSLETKKPKYIRLDGKPLPQIYKDTDHINFNKGFYELAKGKNTCIVSTGFMTQKAIKIKKTLDKEGIYTGIIDVFLMKPLNEKHLFEHLKKYKQIITLQEAYINKGGLDNIIMRILNDKNSHIKLKNLGFQDKYVFDIGNREYIHKLNGLDEESIINHFIKQSYELNNEINMGETYRRVKID